MKNTQLLSESQKALIDAALAEYHDGCITRGKDDPTLASTWAMAAGDAHTLRHLLAEAEEVWVNR